VFILVGLLPVKFRFLLLSSSSWLLAPGFFFILAAFTESTMRTFACFLGILVASATAWAQSPEGSRDWLKKPYDLQLVVYADPHPLLTNLFLEQFVRDLGDSLQRDMGAAARIHSRLYRDMPGEKESAGEDSDRLMQAVVQRGWTELDNQQPLSGSKIHLIRLAYADGEYEIQSRQVDGDTAIVSPLRKGRTADRQWVTRQAALQVAQDFGLCGEITNINAQTLRIQLRAGGLGIPQTIRIGQGEVMALTQIRRTGNGLVSKVLPETLAYITNVDAVRGEVTARIYSRLKDPFEKDKQTVSFRAIKLGTRVVPLNLRVVDSERNPIVGYSVSYFPGGYENGNAEPLGATDSQGRVASRDPIYHVAFVQVQIAGVGKANAPIPLLDDQPVTVEIADTKQAEALALAKFDFDRWLKRANDVIVNFDVDWNVKVEALLKEGKTKEAVENGHAIVKQLREDTGELTKSFKEIKTSAGNIPAAKEMITMGEGLLKDKLNASVKGAEERLDAEGGTAKEDRKLWKQGEKAEQEGDFEQALDLYSKSLKLNQSQPTLLRHYTQLKRHWTIRTGDVDHQKARDFAVNVWSNKKRKLDWVEISKQLATAESIFTDLEPREDYLTGIILLNGNLKQVRTLNEALESLGGGADDAIDKQALIEKTKKNLGNFYTRVYDFVERVKAKREKE
jgi:tetratricopeptide (TPR) repeat protein